MKTTVYTQWGADVVAVSADWAQASDQVEGDEHGRQVADFRHSPFAALRAALEDCASHERLDEAEAEAQIDAAMSFATHASRYIAEYAGGAG